MALLATILVALLPSALPAQTAEPVVVTLANLQRAYSGADATFDTATDVGVTPGTVEDYDVTLSFPGRRTPPRDVGSYTVRVVATSKTDSSLTATANFTLAIAKAPLTVTANDQARLLGVANPRFTLNYDGFVADETETVLNRRPAGTTTARTSSPAGEYEITVIGGSDNNYDIVARNPGTLTIVSAFPGTYESFLFDTGDANLPVGKLTLTLPARGARFTGRLDLASEGSTLPLAGTLSPNEDLSGAQAFAERRATATSVTYRVEFSIDPEGLSAALYRRELGDTENVFHLRVESPVRLVTFTKAEPAPAAGSYTLALLNSLSPFGIDYPGGTSHATGTLAFNGVFKLSGRFADGAKFTASAGADANQGYRLFLRPYGSRLDSFAAGDFTLQAHSSPDREGYFFVPQSLAESFFWTKAPKPSGTPDKLFPQGFGPLDSILVIDPWLRPAKATAGSLAITLAQRLGLSVDPTGSGLATLIHGSPGDDLGDSQFDLPELVEFTPTNKALPVLAAPLPGQKPANPRAWKLAVNAATGAFTASFRLDDEVGVPTEANPGATRNHRRNITVQGVLRQSPEDDTVIGAGYFLLVPRLDMMEFFPDTLSSDFRLQRPDAD